MAYAAPLLRTQTTPVFQNPPMAATPAAARASQLASSPSTFTAGSSTSLSSSLSTATTLVSPSPAPTVQSLSGGGGGPIVTANIINQRADASRSLYQMCVALIQRLKLVPGFEDEYGGQLNAVEPVDTLWALLRTGYPLLTIYNTIQPAEPLTMDLSRDNEAKRAQKMVFKVIQGCSREMGETSADAFMLRDLTDNDTTGFVKVIQFVNRVLDLAGQRGLLLAAAPPPEPGDGGATPAAGAGAGPKMSQRDYVVRELVDTERKYVQDLENLHDLKKTLEQKGVVPGDAIHQIFLNINAILDFQRRFLIRIEATNSIPAGQQQWGSAFTGYEDGFDIYHPFIANQRKASEAATREFDKIRLAEHPVAADINTLDGFLLKPMQRLTKYPLLLKTLLKSLDDDEMKAELAPGANAAERVLSSANEAVNRGMLDEAMDDLMLRVDDWKNHRVEQFGNLLMHGPYAVLTGKSEAEKEYEIYLFESILLCCKEVQPNKIKDKKERTKSTGLKVRNKNVKLQLKGRIFMTNVTDVVSLSKPGSYSVQIWWKGDPGIENFTIRFPTEDMMRSWAVALDMQRKENSPRSSHTIDTQPEFPWLRSQPNVENPYAHQQEEDDDEDADGQQQQYPATASSTVMRNGSVTSLRQRSMTNESQQSIAGMVRGPPTRFPMPSPAPLVLQTQNVAGAATTAPGAGAGAGAGAGGAGSPGPRNGDSYFSPTVESPPSSRTGSGMFPAPASSASYNFPRGSGLEDSNRYTAPAMPRAPSRDGPSPAHQYGMNGRNPRGPSLPSALHPQSAASPPSSFSASSGTAAAAAASAAQQQQRSRSYSTADINGMSPAPRRNTQGAPVPPSANAPAVPGIPTYLQQHHHLHQPAHSPHHNVDIPRSQTASPRAELPVRTSTQSPGTQHRQQPSGSFGGTMSQFPTQPIRQNANTAAPPIGRTASPANPLQQHYQAGADASFASPSQVKVRVTCDNAYFTLVAAFNISYQSLIDRIDVKLARFTSASLARGNLKLRYQDEDGDFITIQSDDDIQIAFLEWRDNLRGQLPADVGEIQLFCVGDGT